MRLLVPPPIYAIGFAGFIWAMSLWFPQFGFDFTGKVVLSGVVAITGLGLDLVSLQRFFKAHTTVSPMSPRDTKTIVEDGIYRYTRNPMYLGLTLILGAFALWIGNLLGFIAIPVFIWVITQFQIRPEEEILLEKFGEPFGDYMMRVRRWI